MSKPFEEMTLDELRFEREYWERKILYAPGWGAGVAVAAELRDECDKWIRRKEQPK